MKNAIIGVEAGRRSGGPIRLLHEILFSLNISYAIAAAVILFRSFRRQGGISSSAGYFLLPGENLFAEVSYGADRALHLGRGSSIGWEIASLASIFLVAALITFMLRLARGTVSARIILGPIAIVTGTALLPAFWLYAVQATWPPVPLYSFWTSYVPALTLLKLSLVLGFVYLTRNNELSVAWRAVALATYYLLWILLPWDLPLWSLRLLFVVFPLSGFAWLAYTNSSSPRQRQRYALPVQGAGPIGSIRSEQTR